MYLNNCRKSYEIILYFITKESEVGVNRKEEESVSAHKMEEKITNKLDSMIVTFRILNFCFSVIKQRKIILQKYSDTKRKHTHINKQTHLTIFVYIQNIHNLYIKT